MKKHDVKKVRATIAALDELEVEPPEIHRRLRENECELGYPVDISRRTVYYHLSKIREERARASTQLDSAAESVAAAKKRSVELLCRHLHQLEQIPPGKITTKQVPVIERIHKALAHMERDERRAAAHKGTYPPNLSQPEGKPETAIERIAREAGEAVPETDGHAT